MEKNERYSRVNFPFLRELKKEFIKNPTVYHLEFKNQIEYCKDDIAKIQQIYFLFGYIPLVYGDNKKNNCENYYIEKNDLFDFLLNSNIKISQNEFRNFLKYFMNGNYDENMNNGFYIWIHSKKIKRSILYFFIFDKDNINIIYSNGEDGTKTLSIDEKNIKLSNEKNYIYIKLAMNLFMYMSAFPENVLNSPPDEECDKLNKNNSKTIFISPTISEYLHENRDVQPHLRRGHFRFLGSDHFTKKRGQTIFVKASFVKGEAKTVI